MRFFFYGTLIDEAVRRAVLGRHAPLRVEPARLGGWRRVAVPGKAYPVVLAEPQASVDGVLARGLTAAARRRLEGYEDADLYAVVEVEVIPVGRRRPIRSQNGRRGAPGPPLCRVELCGVAETRQAAPAA